MAGTSPAMTVEGARRRLYDGETIHNALFDRGFREDG
jgi:hypothetical protein